jgi:hypothetical protein
MVAPTADVSKLEARVLLQDPVATSTEARIARIALKTSASAFEKDAELIYG